jgi:hypothetical protein
VISWGCSTRCGTNRSPYLLLLHELGIGAVIDDIATKDRRRQHSIDFLGIDVLELAVENKVVAGGANSDGGLLAEKNKGKDVAKLEAHGVRDYLGAHQLPW